jgi:hypothetical protein
MNTPNKITAANAGERLGFAGKSRVCLGPWPGVAEFWRSAKSVRCGLAGFLVGAIAASRSIFDAAALGKFERCWAGAGSSEHGALEALLRCGRIGFLARWVLFGRFFGRTSRWSEPVPALRFGA